MWGDAVIQGLWYQQVEDIIDIKLGNSDTDYYKYELMTELLALWETIKKDKHDKHCNDQGKHFSPFVISLGGMIGKEALAVLAQLG